MAHAVLKWFPQLRRITNTPLVQRCLSISRQHGLVNQRAKFVLNEIRGGTRSYRLAADRTRQIVVRHSTRDMDIFDEIFRSPAAYEPPSEAAATLQEIAARRPLRVLDLGANIGLCAVDVLSRYPLAEITSYEPDPDNIRVLERCASLNGVEKWVIVQACAMSSGDSARITAGNFADSYVSDVGVEVVGVDVLPLLGGYDYVKMDIEGSEWPILCDQRWADAMGSVAVLALEWHERGCLATNPRGAAIAAVDAAGFSIDASQPEWHHGTIWGWRSQ